MQRDAQQQPPWSQQVQCIISTRQTLPVCRVVFYTQLYFTKKLVAHNNLKKKRKEKQQYKQDDNHFIGTISSVLELQNVEI